MPFLCVYPHILKNEWKRFSSKHISQSEIIEPALKKDDTIHKQN